MGSPAVALVATTRASALSHLGVLAGLTGWLLYTAQLSALERLHAPLPFCPFYALTGHPCPFCGGTRSFAATWHGDLGRAVHLYPLGPLLFAGACAAAVGSALLLVTRRRARVVLPPGWTFALVVAGAAVLALQWIVKLVWLGN